MSESVARTLPNRCKWSDSYLMAIGEGGIKTREIFEDDLAWLLTGGAASLALKSNFLAIVSALELGGPMSMSREPPSFDIPLQSLRPGGSGLASSR